MQTSWYEAEEIVFKDRFEAGKLLAEQLEKYRDDPNAVILAIPRGGLQTGYALAKELGLKLDIVLTKKIGHPHNSEYAIGAVSLTSQMIDPEMMGISKSYLESETKHIREMLAEREKRYHAESPAISLAGKTVIVTDDGLATGKTAMAAVDLLRKQMPKKIVVAIPVAPSHTMTEMRQHADEVICLSTPENFYAIGQFYRNFQQVEDEEAIAWLKEANL